MTCLCFGIMICVSFVGATTTKQSNQSKNKHMDTLEWNARNKCVSFIFFLLIDGWMSLHHLYSYSCCCCDQHGVNQSSSSFSSSTTRTRNGKKSCCFSCFLSFISLDCNHTSSSSTTKNGKKSCCFSCSFLSFYLIAITQH